MEAFIQALPKAELHIHIEGSLEAELMFEIAQRNGIALPYTVEELKVRKENFANLQEFLDLYYEGTRVLKTEQDFEDLMVGYMHKCTENNIKYTEVFFDPQTHMQNGTSFQTVIQGLYKGKEKGKQMGVEAHLIMCFLKHLTEEDTLGLVEHAKPFAHMILGIGADSTELGNPARKFKRAYAEARAAGLCGPEGTFATCHAGEEGDPSYVIEALSVLHVSRIDHGVRSIEDEFLVTVLKDNQIPLTNCPCSNIALQVNLRFFNNQKVIGELYRKGLCVTVNSDDPAYFGGYLNRNYMDFVESLGDISEDEVRRAVAEVVKNGFRAAWCSQETKEYYLNLVDQAANLS